MKELQLQCQPELYLLNAAKHLVNSPPDAGTVQTVTDNLNVPIFTLSSYDEIQYLQTNQKSMNYYHNDCRVNNSFQAFHEKIIKYMHTLEAYWIHFCFTRQ